jgi:hypothetical protein
MIDDIMRHISQKQIGDKVNLTILRDNATKNVDVILGQMPSQFQNVESNYPEELYDECVRSVGKSFCDFLFKG